MNDSISQKMAVRTQHRMSSAETDCWGNKQLRKLEDADGSVKTPVGDRGAGAGEGHNHWSPKLWKTYCLTLRHDEVLRFGARKYDLLLHEISSSLVQPCFGFGVGMGYPGGLHRAGHLWHDSNSAKAQRSSAWQGQALIKLLLWS